MTLQIGTTHENRSCGFLILSAAFLISVQEVIVKWFDGVMPLWQLFALPGLFSHRSSRSMRGSRSKARSH